MNSEDLNLDDFIENFPFELEETDSGYEYTSDNSDDFSKMYLYVDSYQELQSQETIATEIMTTLVYTDGNYEITLSADMMNDRYICRIGDR
jgi:hypothetical protein